MRMLQHITHGARRLQQHAHATAWLHAAPTTASVHGISTSSSVAAASQEALSEPDIRSAFGYCVDKVRTYDYENYVWMVQLPKHQRPPLFALRAFNIETALVADQVKSKESALSQIRYQWWRDGISAMFKNDPPKHPVLIALHSVLQQQQAAAVAAAAAAAAAAPAAPGAAKPAAAASKPQWRQYGFKRIIDAREQDALDTQPPLTMDGLESYAEGTASQLLYLQLAALGVSSREADHAASHLGKAVGIATLLRGTHAHAAAHRSYMPIELCVKHGVSQEDIYSGNVTEGLRDVVLAVASVAKGHLEEAQALAPKIPKEAHPVMMPAVACEAYLNALEAANFNPFDPSLQQRPGGLPLAHVLKVKWHMLRGTY